MRTLALLLIGVVSGCASSDRSNEEHVVACAAQRFVRENGYLDQRTTGPVALELWDGLQFASTIGEYDWDALGASRYQTLTHRLRGVVRSDGDFLVMYGGERGGGFKCLRVSADLTQFHMHEATCRRRPGPMVRFDDRSLDCES